jgi:clan AA aspartic protease
MSITNGRALITVSIRPFDTAAPHDVETWIDTGFNGELVLPQKEIDGHALAESGTVKAILADGSVIALRRYACLIEWFGELRELEVIANDGEYPLLGVGLLLGHDLRISYRDGRVEID